MSQKTGLILFVFMSILSCNKSKEFAKELTLEEETEALKNLIEYFDLLERSKDYVFLK